MSVSERAVTGLLIASLAQLIQYAFFLAARVELDAWFFASHFIAVAAFHLFIAITLGPWRNQRLWETAAFVFPIATQIRALMATQWGRSGTLLAIGLTALLCVVLLLRKHRPGAPLIAAVLGAAIGGALGHIREAMTQGEDVASVEGLWALCVVLVAFALAKVCLARLHDLAVLGKSIAAGIFFFVGAACALAPRLLPGPTPPAGLSQTAGPPIVLVVLDTVRASHLDLYGYQRETMPRLTAFARQYATTVDRSIANAPSSLPTHASLFTGLYPLNHGAHKPFLTDSNPPPYAYPLGPTAPTLASLLSAAGYWTVGISGNDGALRSYGLDRGFQFYVAEESSRGMGKRRSPWLPEFSRAAAQSILLAIDTLPPFREAEIFSGPGYRRAASITDQAIKIIDAADGVPFFLFLNYMDAHTPYLPPPGYRDRFPGINLELGRGKLPREATDEIMRGERDVRDDEFAHLTALYDSELVYLDDELARLLERIQQLPNWEEVLIVITSDHGEAFGEHRMLEHTVGLYDEMLWVPLVIKPGSGSPHAPSPGSSIPGPFQSVDVFPTILQHAGIAIPEPVDGLAWGIGRQRSYSWCYVHQIHVVRKNFRFRRELRSVQDEGFLLIESTDGSRELYDLQEDPHATTNVSNQHAERVASLRSTIPDEASDVRMPRDQEPESEAMLERLRALGYVE